MSRRAVSKALNAIEKGSSATEIREILRDVNASFIRKRITHLIHTSDPNSGLGERLWNELFSDSPPIRPDSPSPAGSESGRTDKVSETFGPAHQLDEAEIELPLSTISLDNPAVFLEWLMKPTSKVLSLAGIRVFEAWAIVASAVPARIESESTLRVIDYDQSQAGGFVRAIGLPDLIQNIPPDTPGEPGRTAKLRRLTAFGEIERAAEEISRLLVLEENQKDTRLALKYVIVELLRNAIQHSGDALGGVVAAQRMDHRGENQRFLQVAVADGGRESLRQ
ncbi:MAG: hypothetical protein J4G09_11565 [Proteobacteria bacterium]|nr:hypothetical protein [Pseudomonadota bacterium]